MSEQLKIQAPKGRPMFYWVGKKPIQTVKGFPAQLIEFHNPKNDIKPVDSPDYKELEKNWYNLLFEGDNEEVLATLLENGYRSKIDLIYIDPPYASNRDYLRKVKLKGFKGNEIEEDEAPLLQQIMYEDIWKRDEYFQWIYERLILMKELLSDSGSIYVHLDYRMVHYVKLIMDEIFGGENFRNEIIWNKGFRGTESKNIYQHAHDVILWYSKSKNYVWNDVWQPYRDTDMNRYNKIDEEGNKYAQIKRRKTDGTIYYGKTYPKTEGKRIDDVINHVAIMASTSGERTGFETQKPEDLLEIFIKASTNFDDLILDCFIGSGTTVRVAQKLGRRWIGCDINKGAIQLTAQGISKIIREQLEKDKNLKLIQDNKVKIYSSFANYKVNDYEFKQFQSEAKELAVKHLEIEKMGTDNFFEGKLGKRLVKIIDFNHPLNLIDLENIKDELKKRDNEERNITIVTYGQEINTYLWIEEWNKRMPVNKIEVVNLKTNKETGGFLIYEPPQADIEIKRINKNKAKIKINDFISPTVIKRFNLAKTLLDKDMPDFRSMIEYVAVDVNYNEKFFQTIYIDIPEKQKDLIKADYDIDIQNKKIKIAVKIVDVLGGELLVSKEI